MKCKPSSPRNIDDVRFSENDAVLQWFKEWYAEVQSNAGLTATEKARRFISPKTHFDICSMVIGFKSFCNTLLEKLEGVHITTHRTSQDYLELFFACQRAQNAQNNNPTIMQYGEKTFEPVNEESEAK